MSPIPLRRAAAAVVLSVLALGGSAVAAQAEPAPGIGVCAAPTAGPTYTSLDGDGIGLELSPGKATAELVDGGLSIAATHGKVGFTDHGIAPFALAGSGAPALDYTKVSGDRPGLVLSYALEGTDWAGTLVHEPERLGEGKWWSSRTHGSFAKYQTFTLGQWLAEFPGTTIIGVGFALGPVATGAGVVHGFTAGCTTYAFDVEDVTPTPTPTPAPTTTPTPAPTPAPTLTPTPTLPPTGPGPATVPSVVVHQPACVGTTVTAGRIVVTPGATTDWVLVAAGVAPTQDSDLVAAPDALGAPADVQVPAGSYEVWAVADTAWGDLGRWQVVDGPVIRLTVTVEELSGPCPVATTPAWTPSADHLVPAARGGFTTAAGVDQGGTLVLRDLPAGAQVHAYLFSTPTDLGLATVASDGTLKVTIPATTPVGTHRVAVYAADGTLLGWQYVEVLAAGGGALAATGADPRAGVLGAAVLVAAGGALVLARRRLTV